MDESPIHELFDVSVLFDSAERAGSAWAEIFQTDAAEYVIGEGKLNGIGWLQRKPMPAEILDTRLIGESFSAGAAYVGLKLGVQSQFAIRQMLTNPATGLSPYPDPWTEDGLIRKASILIDNFLQLGGTAVVLHKAAGLVRTSDHFRSQVGDPRDLSLRPYLAWLDLMASEDGQGGVVCRSYGMPHYFGAPNIRASAPNSDFQTVECSMQAVRQVCGKIAGNNESPFTIKTVSVASSYVGDIPTLLPAIEWTASYDEDNLLITLGSNAFGGREPPRLLSRLKTLFRKT